MKPVLISFGVFLHRDVRVGVKLHMVNGIRLEGITLSVANVERSIAFYRDKLGLQVEVDKPPQFGMIRVGDKNGGTIGLLSMELADGAAAKIWTPEQRAAIHVELSTDNLDAFYREPTARGVNFHTPPHDEPWERCMDLLDPDGYTVEIAQGRPGDATRPTEPEQVRLRNPKCFRTI